MTLAEALISAVAPHDCLGCGDEAGLLCKSCLLSIGSRVPSRCYRCRTVTTSFAVCPSCRSSSNLRRVWTRTEHSGLAKQLLFAFKFERAQAGAIYLGDLMSEGVDLKAAIVIPLPTATQRLRERGYDHAALLAKRVAFQKGLYYLPVLHRLNQSRQVGAKRDQRLSQLKDTFWVKAPEQVCGKHILLVDDVITTGASLEEAAKTMRAAGALRVDALVFAQA